MDKFMEELEAMDLEAVVARMAEMDVEVRESEDEALIAERTEQKKLLLERKAELEDLEKRQKEAEAIENDTVETETIETHTEERKEMTEMEIRNSKEYIDAFANYIKTGEDAECRKLLTENVNGGVAVPELVDGIVRTAWEEEGIMSLVRKSYIKGNLKVGFEISADGAVIHTEGTDAPTQENLVLGIVNLVPASIKKWITVSDEAMDLTGSEFLQYVYNEVAHQIAKKAADTLIEKIEAAGTVSTTTAVGVPVITEATIGQDTIAKAIAALSDQATRPTIMMNKATWASFKGVQYSGNYGVDIFEGLDVKFNNTIKAYTAASTGDTYVIVGDLGYGAQANFPNGEEITFKFDDLSLAEADLVKIVGREFVALGLVAPNAFVKVQK